MAFFSHIHVADHRKNSSFQSSQKIFDKISKNKSCPVISDYVSINNSAKIVN